MDLFGNLLKSANQKKGNLYLMYWQVWSCPWALVAKSLHNTFYVTDMVDYTVFNDHTTHHHDYLKQQLDCCLRQVMMTSLFLVNKEHVIQYNLRPIIENMSQTQPCFYCNLGLKSCGQLNWRTWNTFRNFHKTLLTGRKTKNSNVHHRLLTVVKWIIQLSSYNAQFAAKICGMFCQIYCRTSSETCRQSQNEISISSLRDRHLLNTPHACRTMPRLGRSCADRGLVLFLCYGVVSACKWAESKLSDGAVHKPLKGYSHQMRNENVKQMANQGLFTPSKYSSALF